MAYRKLKNKEFVVHMDRWARSGDDHPDMGTSKLKNPEGNMCCLGFVCGAEGFQNLLGENEPADLSFDCIEARDLQHLTHHGSNTRFTAEAISINDDPTTTDLEKITKLKKLFASKGLTIKFVGTI